MSDIRELGMSVTTLPVVRSFRTHPSALPEIRDFVRHQSTQAGVYGEAADDLVLAVTELC